MKLLFWSGLILATIWLLFRKKLGANNDLTAHFAEQNALQSVGNSALSANEITTNNNPLATIGDTPLAGIWLDHLNPSNPFASPKVAQPYPSTPIPNPGDVNGGYVDSTGRFVAPTTSSLPPLPIYSGTNPNN